MAKTPARAAKEIIDDALGDNRSWEWLCYVLVILLVLTGLATLVVGLVTGKEVVTLSGVGVTGLFWPAMGYARRFREANIRVRLYELALAMAKTPEEAAAALREALGAKPPDAQPPTGAPRP